MIGTCGILLLVTIGAAALFAIAFALSFRRGIGAPDPLTGSAELLDVPALQLALYLRATKKVSITGIDVPLSVVRELGLQAPAGFSSQPYSAPDSSVFEPDLEPLLDDVANPSDAQIEAETQRQFKEHAAVVQRLNSEFAHFAGRLPAKPHIDTVIRFAAAQAAPVKGDLSVHYRHRTGLFSTLRALSVPFRSPFHR